MPRTRNFIAPLIAMAMFLTSLMVVPWEISYNNGSYVIHSPIWSKPRGGNLKEFTLGIEWLTIALTWHWMRAWLREQGDDAEHA